MLGRQAKIFAELNLSQYTKPVRVKDTLQLQTRYRFRVAGSEGSERLVYGNPEEELLQIVMLAQTIAAQAQKQEPNLAGEFMVKLLKAYTGRSEAEIARWKQRRADRQAAREKQEAAAAVERQQRDKQAAEERKRQDAAELAALQQRQQLSEQRRRQQELAERRDEIKARIEEAKHKIAQFEREQDMYLQRSKNNNPDFRRNMLTMAHGYDRRIAEQQSKLQELVYALQALERPAPTGCVAPPIKQNTPYRDARALILEKGFQVQRSLRRDFVDGDDKVDQHCFQDLDLCNRYAEIEHCEKNGPCRMAFTDASGNRFLLQTAGNLMRDEAVVTSTTLQCKQRP